MELEIGPFLKMRDSGAIIFTRSFIGFGILMIGLFLWKRRTGYFLVLIWSVWWGAILSTGLLSSTSMSDRISILIVVGLFITSAWFAFKHLNAKSPPAIN